MIHPRAVLVVVASALAAPAMGQYALDRNQAIGSGGINAPSRNVNVMRPDIYRVNYSTGEMQYDRSAAFDEPLYSIYERYSMDRFDNFVPEGVSTGTRVERSTSAPRATYRAPGSGRQTGSQRVSSLSRASRATTAPRASATGSALTASRYSVSRTAPSTASSTLHAPTYSAARR